MTNDNSIGLYDEDVNDIYHSAFGAVSEAYEKFVNPFFEQYERLSNYSKLNILDICYGIGYNTKAFLSECIRHNLKASINISCVDVDDELIKLSPFIKNRINLLERLLNKRLLYKNISNYSEAIKIINIKNNIKSIYRISNYANYILLINMIDQFGIDFSDKIKKYITKNENYPFFDKSMLNFIKFLNELGVYYIKNKNKSSFVHNIYYKYISKQYSMYKKILDFNLFKTTFYPVDIRTHLKSTDIKYDVVFLDGFTPAKCPCIWTLDFFKELSTHMSENCLLLTYNTSAPVRNAMRLAGLYIGTTNSKHKNNIGTVASKNKSLILTPLSEAQEGLLNTKAGIPYRDNDLSLDNGTILLNRKNEVSNSKLISSSQYLKEIKNEV